MAIDFTTCIGVDAKYIEQLRVVVPTWRLHRPEIWQQPMIVFYDRDQLSRADLAWLDHPNLRLVEWPPSSPFSHVAYESQRERMLAGFIHVPPQLVETRYWLKIDCDTVAMRSCEWIRDEWFNNGVGEPVFVASSWSYTKPADAMDRLDDWADGVPELAKRLRLNIPREPGDNVLRHRRMASWVSFYRTEWTARVAQFCQPNRIPIPSQDGFHWYCAARMGVYWHAARMKDFGWANSLRLARVKELAAEAMAVV